MESVFALKARTGEIEPEAVLIARRRLDADLGRRRLLVAATSDDHFRDARRLLIKHGSTEALRTLDALQIAIALALKRAGLVKVFIAADQKLCRVAELEGFEVTNPEQPGAVVI